MSAFPKPLLVPPLDQDFSPAAIAHREFEELAKESGGPRLGFALLREGDKVSRFEAPLLPSGHPRSAHNARHAISLLKFLLWQRGARRVLVAGPREVFDELARCFSPTGARSFDARFMAEVYRVEQMLVEHRPFEALPEECDEGLTLGQAASGCRIGFDAGGSDRKVVAVVDGRVVYSSEVVWHPKRVSDPSYHIAGVRDSLEQAARHLPRVDALGVSSAGIYVDNQTRVASLFRKVPKEAFEAQIRDIYINLARELGVPLTVANDGDVAALAGAQSLGDHPVLGLALGTSLAAGYIDPRGRLTGWLNELSFTPVDYAASGVVDVEWSGDRGVGSSYLSQDAAIRLARVAGLYLDEALPPAELLQQIQRRTELGDDRCLAVFETLGIYLGYALLLYSRFYALRHVLVLGRVTSGAGGERSVAVARRVLKEEDGALADRVQVHLPDEAERRLGQSVAAASLPRLSSPA